jgi:Na+/proline symporter
MQLTTVDWVVIVAYFVLSLAIGLYYTRRASRSVEEFFLSDRSLPWWLVGTSMVATTFAADTPLAVTELVARSGVAGNWLWWSLVASSMLTVFFYARLWRRAGVMTDVELAEIRYSGKPAAFLRGFRAFYLGLMVNCLIMGWVTLGMARVMVLGLGIGKVPAIAICLIITVVYSVLSGLWGVVVTDAVQFVIAMTGSIALAFFAVSATGGMENLIQQVTQHYGSRAAALSPWPGLDSGWLPVLTLFVYIGVLWWASWYPGAEPGGGGYVAQRIFSAKDEKHSLLATLWFNIAHYGLRPWPWIIVALASIVLYPGGVANPETGQPDPALGYVQVMIDYLPEWWRGLLIAAFFAAYMSTIATHLNWGASYLVNDFYRRFVKTSGDEKHYVLISRLATLTIMVISGIVTYYLQSITGAWELLLLVSAGTGPVFILRWFWWRISAWSEVAAMATAFLMASLLWAFKPFAGDLSMVFAKSMLVIVPITTVVWLAVTFLTRPEPEETLIQFYRRVGPGGPGWKPIAAKAGVTKPSPLGLLFLSWVMGCMLVYCCLFGIGKLIFNEWLSAVVYLGCSLLAGVIVFWSLSRQGWQALATGPRGVTTEQTATGD